MDTTTAPIPLVDEDRLTIPAVEVGSEYLGMGRQAVYRAIAAGTFPLRTIRAGGRWLVATADVRQLLGVHTDN